MFYFTILMNGADSSGRQPFIDNGGTTSPNPVISISVSSTFSSVPTAQYFNLLFPAPGREAFSWFLVASLRNESAKSKSHSSHSNLKPMAEKQKRSSLFLIFIYLPRLVT